MKILTFNLSAMLLPALLCCCGAAAGAQEIPAYWIKVAPAGEAFTVMMPSTPSAKDESRQVDGLHVSGQRYRVKDTGDAVYTIWSFRADSVPSDVQQDREAYLDLCAELTWDMLVRSDHKARMTYGRDLPSASHPGRNYLFNIGKRRGAAQIYIAESRIYIVTALGEADEVPHPEIFMKSFSPGAQGSQEADPSTGGGGVGPGRGGNSGNDSSDGGSVKAGEPKSDGMIDYTQPFSASALTQKARIISKPEPLYTEAARKFAVSGTISMRLILMASGEVGGITIIKRLPHGLTQKAIEAAKQTKFEPAMKDGRLVSQYVQMEYNFNIY